ncbi:hypothetical protein [Undibacterium sp.]
MHAFNKRRMTFGMGVVFASLALALAPADESSLWQGRGTSDARWRIP